MQKRFTSLRNLSQEQGLLLLLVISTFLPFYITVPLLLAAFGWILCKPAYRKALLAPKYAIALPCFCGLTAWMALWFQNWFGLLCSVAFYIILSISGFVRRYITPQNRIHLLRWVCLLGGTCGGFALLDWLWQVFWLKTPAEVYRCQLWFFNANYMATMLLAGTMACVYLLIVRQVSKKHALPCLVLQLLGVYFTGSAFTWLAMAVGICALLWLVRRVRFLYILLFFAAAGVALLALVPVVMARWHEMDDTLLIRFDIWAATWEDIRQHFVFGRGFFGYFQLSMQNPALYQTTHAHNLVLDSLLNYGLVGCAAAATFFVPYFKEVLHRWRKQEVYCGFVLAGMAAVLAHSMVDMTMLWVQTGLLFSILMGCIGEKEGETRDE